MAFNYKWQQQTCSLLSSSFSFSKNKEKNKRSQNKPKKREKKNNKDEKEAISFSVFLSCGYFYFLIVKDSTLRVMHVCKTRRFKCVDFGGVCLES